MVWPQALFISDIEALKAFISVNKVNWGQLTKYKNKDTFPIFDLLKSYGGNTLGEKAYRAVNGDAYCKCGEKTIFYNWKRGYGQFCGKKCAIDFTDWNKATEKTRQTSIERHGGVGLSSPSIKAKAHKTNIEKYGHISPATSPDVRKKIEEEMIKRYGTSIPYKNVDIAIKGGLKKKFNTWTNNILKLKDEYVFIDEQPLVPNEDRKWKHIACGNEFSHNWALKQRAPVCRVCFPMIKGTSKSEDEISQVLPKNIEIERNKRFYFGNRYYELDIFLPEFNLGIEYNGLFWHSEQAGKDRFYHVEKMDFFNKKDIRVLFIFEHEWHRNKNVCISMINNVIGNIENKIYARKCQIKEIDKKQADDFINENHVSGVASSTIQIGLFHNNELVSVGTFKKSRYTRDNSFELIRFCSRCNHSVVGGLSKIVSFFQNKYKMDVVSYCNLRYGNGNGYLKAGFTLIKKTDPGYWYFDKDDVYHRSVFQKKKLQQITNKNGTEADLAKLIGLNRFWDCGNLLFGKKYEAINNV